MFEDADDLACFFDTDGFALSAIYKTGGTGDGVTIPVLPALAQDSVSVFGQEVISEGYSYVVRASDVTQPAEGDTVEVNGSVRTVKADPVAGLTRTIWKIDTY